MAGKVKFEQEYLIKSSPKVINSMITTPSGLSEWFADDINIKDDIYTFYWNGSEEQARLLGKKPNEYIKLRWLEDEEEEEGEEEPYLEISFKVDPMTKFVVLNITSFSDEEELEESRLYWDSTIEDLRRVIGA